MAHTSKQEGSWLLVFRQTSLTFFVVGGTGGTAVYLQRISPRYRLPPARRPITQELLKANVSQGEGVAFLPEVSPWWPLKDLLHPRLSQRLIYFLIVKQKPGSGRRHPSLCFEDGPPRGPTVIRRAA